METTPGSSERTQIAVYKKYTSEFSVLDWAFTVLTALNIGALIFAYFKKARVEQFFFDFQLELPTFTKIALSVWFLPLIVIFPIVLLIYTLNPRTPLVTNGRHILILFAFILNLIGSSAFCYALRLPFKNRVQMLIQSKPEIAPPSVAPKPIKRSPHKRRR